MYVYIYTCLARDSLGADVSEITERGTLAGQGDKVQCTHPFTVASLSRVLSSTLPPPMSPSATFPSFFVCRAPRLFSLSLAQPLQLQLHPTVSRMAVGVTLY